MFFSVLIIVIKVLLLLSADAADEKTSCRKMVSFEETEKPINSKYLRTRGVIDVVQPLPINIMVKFQIPVYFTKMVEGEIRPANLNDGTKFTDPGKPYSAKFYLYFQKDLPLPTIILVQVNDKVLCMEDPISSLNKTTITRYYSIKRSIGNFSTIDPHPETNDPKNPKNERDEENLSDRFMFFRFHHSHLYPVEYYHHNPFLHQTKRQKEGLEPNSYIHNFSTNHVGHYHSNPFLYPSERPTPVLTPTAKPTPRPIPKPTPIPTSAPMAFKPPSTVSPPGSCDNANWKKCCGMSINSNHLIVNGIEARKGDFRWMVPLYKMTKPENRYYEFICSSTLISDNYIMSAAHCVVESRSVIDETKYLAPVGMFELGNWEDPDVQSRYISQIYVHSDYDGGQDGDIALLKLAQKVNIGPAVVPACIWSEEGDLNLIAGRKSITFGWGRDSKGQITKVPNFAMMPIVSQEQCLSSNVNFQTMTSNRTFCAGKKDGSGPCKGDSGGGLMLAKKQTDGTLRWYLRGVVSSSLHSSDLLSCDLYNYIIFSDVAKFKRWVSFYIYM